MYQLNRTGRPVLITPSEVIKKTGTTHTIDPTTIGKSIVIAEEEYIRNALGFQYYESLLAEKNKVITGSNQSVYQPKFNTLIYNDEETGKPVTGYTLQEDDMINASELMSPASKELWNMFLWQLIAECVAAVTLPENYVQQKSEGAVHVAPSASAIGATGVGTPSLSSMKWALDQKMKSRIDPLMEAMHKWLCEKNKVLVAGVKPYPLYKRPCDCDKNGVPYKRKTDLILTMYDDPQPCGCDWSIFRDIREFDEETGAYINGVE